ncbi:MAG TPA: M14 family zinc carboxypeptidase [Burkholderiaceae bacterium]
MQAAPKLAAPERKAAPAPAKAGKAVVKPAPRNVRAAKPAPARNAKSPAKTAKTTPVKAPTAKAAVLVAPVAVAAAVAAAPAPSGMGALCARLITRLPGVTNAECEQSGLKPTGAMSRKGMPILAREILPLSSSKQPLRVLLLGGIHGDELTASAIVFEWMQWMTRPIAGSFHWRVAPVVNPDGLLAPKPTRVNAHGVDINRNFPTPGWLNDAPKYWAKVTNSDPRRFPGTAPLSEPESKWVNDEIERFKPDVIISVHAPFGVLDFDGPAPVPQRFGLLRFNRVGVYPGSLGNYLGMYKNTPVITLELPNAQAMPPPVEVQRIWADMLTWIRQNVGPEGPVRTAAKR